MNMGRFACALSRALVKMEVIDIRILNFSELVNLVNFVGKKDHQINREILIFFLTLLRGSFSFTEKKIKLFSHQEGLGHGQHHVLSATPFRYKHIPLVKYQTSSSKLTYIFQTSLDIRTIVISHQFANS